MSEEWKQYKDTVLAFSNQGRVYNLKTGHYLKLFGSGVVHVHYRKNKYVSAARAIYELFVGEIPKGYCVYKRDFNPLSCKLDNLYIGPKNCTNSAIRVKGNKAIRIPVRCLETNHVFKSVKEAADYQQVSQMTMIHHLKYNSPNNLEGFHYVYERDYQDSID